MLKMFRTPLELTQEFYDKPEMREKYFANYELLYPSEKDKEQVLKLILVDAQNNYREVTNIDLVDLQTELMLSEKINVKSFYILSSALVNYIRRLDKENDRKPRVNIDESFTEDDLLLDLAEKSYENFGYVIPAKVLEDFGLQPKDYKKYDKKLAQILLQHGFTKTRRTMNKVKYTIYERQDNP